MEMPSCGAAGVGGVTECRGVSRAGGPRRTQGLLDLVGADICSRVGVRAMNGGRIIFLPGSGHRGHNSYR